MSRVDEKPVTDMVITPVPLMMRAAVITGGVEFRVIVLDGAGLGVISLPFASASVARRVMIPATVPVAN